MLLSANPRSLWALKKFYPFYGKRADGFRRNLSHHPQIAPHFVSPYPGAVLAFFRVVASSQIYPLARKPPERPPHTLNSSCKRGNPILNKPSALRELTASRGEATRTPDLYVPNVARAPTVLHPESVSECKISHFFCIDQIKPADFFKKFATYCRQVYLSR